MSTGLRYKVADSPEEIDAIHALNYRTFVEEIPQHAQNGDRRLVDRFHDENSYLIAQAGPQLVGMLALRAERPFSLDAKLPDLDTHLPPGRRWGEVRLLAVERAWRGSGVFAGLLRLLEREFATRGLDAAVVSATTRQMRLYQHLGFEPFGPLVGREGAWYQPMHLRLERFQKAVASKLRREPVNLLPGPVAMPAAVRRAFREGAVSHRSDAVLAQVRACRAALRTLTGAPHAALLPGGGTLANEVVCAQIARLGAPGLVVSQGEFGERLADHARRAALPHDHWSQPWGEPLDYDALDQWLTAQPETCWLWAVHCETSTGAFACPGKLRALCAARGIRLCLDCVSSLGVVPVDLRGVFLASGSSGKGLAAVPGIGLVFSASPAEPSPTAIPRALDLGLYATEEGMPFTLGSNVIAALHASLLHTDWPAKFQRVEEMAVRLREELCAHNLTLVDPAASTVLTIALPGGSEATAIASALARRGWLVAAHSRHLQQRGWLQICLMGDLSSRDLDGLAPALAVEVFGNNG